MDRQAVQVEQAVFNAENKRSKVRWMILAALFFITCINYADRAAISIAGPAITKELCLDAVGMGYVFSAFGWAYVAGQLPGGWLLDKFGSRRVYAWSIFIWSLFTFIQGGVAFLAGTAALVALFSLRFLLGAAEYSHPALRNLASQLLYPTPIHKSQGQ